MKETTHIQIGTNKDPIERIKEVLGVKSLFLQVLGFKLKLK